MCVVALRWRRLFVSVGNDYANVELHSLLRIRELSCTIFYYSIFHAFPLVLVALTIALSFSSLHRNPPPSST